MKLLTCVTIALIPTIVTSNLCTNPQLKCIELCCPNTQVYNAETKYCEDMPKVATATWQAILYDTKPESERKSVEIVEYDKCKPYSTIPFCYSPYYNMVTNRTTLLKMFDVPCNRLQRKPVVSFWSTVYMGCYFLGSICLPIMTVYTCRKVEFIYKLLSWYMGSVAMVVLMMTGCMCHIPFVKLEDRERIYAIYSNTMRYFALSSYLWQNVIGFQLWSGFKATNTRHDASDNDRKRLIYYSIYVWGIAAIVYSIRYLLKGKKTSVFIFNTSTFSAVPCFNLLTFVILSVNICVIRCGVVNLTNEVNFKFKLTLTILRLALVMGFARLGVLVLNQIVPINQTIYLALNLLEPVVVFIVLVCKPKNWFNCTIGCWCCRKTQETSNVTEVVYTP